MQPVKFRSKLGIYLEILTAVNDEGHAKPTRILQRANLPHDRFTRYLRELVNRDLVAEDRLDRNKTYLLTSRGKIFLEEMSRKEEFLTGFGLSLRV